MTTRVSFGHLKNPVIDKTSLLLEAYFILSSMSLAGHSAQEKDDCGLNSTMLNDFLECCFDQTHVVPEGPKVSTENLDMDLKLWDFDPNCCIDLCHTDDTISDIPTPIYPTLAQKDCQDHHCNNTPCCNRDDGLCDLDQHLKPDDLVNLDSILSKCMEDNNYSTVNNGYNVSGLRDTINNHHHHLLHLHHGDKDSNYHSHDLVLHHHDHKGQNGEHHHHLKIPDLEQDFILPNCSKQTDTLGQNKLDFITFAGTGNQSGYQMQLPGLKQRLKRKLNGEVDNSSNHHHHHNHHQHCLPANQIKNGIKTEEDEEEDESYKQVCQWLDCNEHVPELNQHMIETHLNSSDLKCQWNNCDFTGNELDQLISHISTHKDEKPVHECKWVNEDGTICDRQFGSTSELTNHLTSAHIGQGKTEYVCRWEGCERNHRPFGQKQKIIRHMNTHTKHQPFECSICHKRFSLRLILKQHMRIHTGETPYKCDICNKSFKTSSSLTIHKRVHSGIKPLECPVCHKFFNESSNLNKHIKTHMRQFKCSTCHRSFDDEDKFKKHVNICKQYAEHC